MSRPVSNHRQSINFVSGILVALVRQGQKAIDLRENKHQRRFAAIMNWLQQKQPDHPACRLFISRPLTGVYPDFDTILMYYLPRDFMTAVPGNGVAVDLLQTKEEAHTYWQTLSEAEQALYDQLANIFLENVSLPVC